MALQEIQEFDGDLSGRKFPESSFFHCVATPLQEKNTVAWFLLFLSPFLLEEEKIKSFPLITLGYGHSGLFGMADRESISYSAVITNVLVRQPQWNQINILIPPLHYTTSSRHHLPHQVYGFYFRIWLARAARWRGYDRGWYIWTTGRRAAEKPASAARIFFRFLPRRSSSNASIHERAPGSIVCAVTCLSR